MNTTKSIVYIALFAAMIAAGAWITIPSFPAPFTLQTFFCMLAGGLLGARRGAICCLIYLLTGLVGIPVFTQGGGFQYIFQPTFGYLLGLVPAAFLMGLFLQKYKGNKFYWVWLIFFLASLIILAIGFAYYVLLIRPEGGAVWVSFVSLFLIFIPAELLKSAASSVLYLNLKKYFPECG